MTARTPGDSMSDVDKEKYYGTPADVRAIPLKERAPEHYFVNRYGALGPTMAKLFASGVEARGIERVPEDERETKNTWNKCVINVACRLAGRSL